MLIKIGKTALLVIMILMGLLFISNIYVLGNVEAAIEMHDDLAPTASAFMVNTKVLICFVVGILYVLSAYGIIRKKYSLALAGIIGFILFDGFYIVQLVMWAGIHPRMWIDFSIFGGLSLLFGVFSWYHWKNRLITA
ncbi:MAG: hypothetical protein GY754_15930 [bacterium]|nr:hypothetical protein [bacterium]